MIKPDWWLVESEMGKVIFHGADRERAEKVANIYGRPAQPLYFSPPELVASKFIHVPVTPTKRMMVAGSSWSGLPAQTWEDMIEAWLDDCCEDEPEGWSPISSAPKDGTIVDLLTRSGEVATEQWWIEDGDEAFWSCDFDDAYVTHWRPAASVVVST